MKNNKIIMRYTYEIFGRTTTINVLCNSINEALEAGNERLSAFWVSRVEVWKGDFRILLAVKSPKTKNNNNN